MSYLIEILKLIHQSWGFSESVSLFWVFWAFIVFWTLIHSGDGRERFLKTIREASLGQFYRKQLRRFLFYIAMLWFKDARVIQRGRSQLKKLNENNSILGVNSFTEPAFVFSLKFALIYPILSVFLFWVLSGKGGSPGDLNIFPEKTHEAIRWMILVLMLVGLMVAKNAYKSQGMKAIIWMLGVIGVAIALIGDEVGLGLVGSTLAVVVAVAGAVAVAIAVTVPGAVAVAVVVAVSGSVAVANAEPDVVAVVIAGAVATATYFIADYIYQFCQFRQLLKWFWLIYLAFIVAVDALVIYKFANLVNGYKYSLIYLLFYSILPILNAPLDWSSIAITRSLLYAIVDQVHSGLRAFLWAVLDLLVALILLIAITLVITIAIASFNKLAGDGNAIVDLAKIFNSISNNPLAVENWWIYVMLLSTLVPTFLHMVIAGFSMILWIPEHWLKWVAEGWKPNQHKEDLPKFLLAWGYLSVVSPLTLIAPFALLGGSIWLLLQPGSGDQLGNWLLVTAESIASTINTLFDEMVSSP